MLVKANKRIIVSSIQPALVTKTWRRYNFVEASGLSKVPKIAEQQVGIKLGIDGDAPDPTRQKVE